MRSLQISTFASILAVGLAAAACSSDKPAEEAAPAATAGGEGSTAAQRDISLTPETATEGAEPCALGTVHFTFDSADLDEASKAAISDAVECYRTNGAPARLHLTGATDPRGTEEYNIALGERRAVSVRKYMEALGVAAERIAVNSVGEEMAEGTDEAGWAQDRKVSGEEDGAQ